MKKILMLGGSHFQVPSIIKAKEMGYYVITCDFLPGNPGHQYADEYFNVSTTDKEAVLKLARDCKVDGVVCYASDPAAATAAYVCEKMGFPTNPYKSVEILSNKDKFRDFLRKNHFCVPKAEGYSEAETQRTIRELKDFRLPVMVKPVDSSGSKGVTKVEEAGAMGKAIQYALRFSRCKRFIVEEYVNMYGYQVDGDGFSVEGELRFRCFANGHFEADGTNPYVPVGESFPYNMPEEIQQKIHEEIQRALSLLGMQTNAYNLEIRIDEELNVYLMEIGPRNGGNLIPQVTRYATGVDMVEYTIRSAMGESCEALKQVCPKGYWASYMIHSKSGGRLKEVRVEPGFKQKNIVEYQMMFQPGDMVEPFTGSNGILGTMILRFDSMEEMLQKMDHMEQWVSVVLEEAEN